MAKDRKLYLNERTTIRDVAQEAGVSLTTVSHALNGYKDVSEKTRQKVMEVARRLDYMPDEAVPLTKRHTEEDNCTAACRGIAGRRSERYDVWTYEWNL